MTDHAAPDLIPRHKLFGNPSRAMCRLSPDGTTLSWLQPRDGVLNIWTAPVGDPADARALTNDRMRGIRFYAWARDARHLLYIQDKGGDENWHVHAVDMQTGEERDLTPIDGVNARFEKLSWERPGEIVLGLNDRDARWHDLYVVDIASGERSLHYENRDEHAGFTLDSGFGLRIAEKTREGGGRSVLRYDGEGFAPMLEIGHEDDIATNVLGFEADGAHFHMLSSLGRDTASLIRRNWESGEEVVVGAHAAADVNRLITHPVSNAIEAYGANPLTQEWYPVGDSIRDDLAFLDTNLAGEIEITSRTRADNVWVIANASATDPGSYHLYTRQDGALRRLFSTRPELDDHALKPMYPVKIAARDGLQLPSYLTLPEQTTEPVALGNTPAAEDGPYPMVLNVHGGPWARDGYGFDPAHQWLADRGYAVLSVNFRGSVGFGKDFINAGDLEWGRAMHDDLLDAVAWAIDNGYARTDRVAIMGGSYGGYATLAGLTFTPDVFCCGVDIVGPSNLETLLETIPPYWQAAFENLARRVGDPRTEEGRALLRERSPLHKAEEIEKPLLIGQGANDPRVKQAESDQIVAAMQEKGLPVIYALYPDEGHGFARPQNRLSFFALAEAFLAAHLGGAAEPLGNDLDDTSLTVPTGKNELPGLAQALA